MLPWCRALIQLCLDKSYKLHRLLTLSRPPPRSKITISSKLRKRRRSLNSLSTLNSLNSLNSQYLYSLNSLNSLNSLYHPFKRSSSVSRFFHFRRGYAPQKSRMAIGIVLIVQPNCHSNKVQQKPAKIKKRRPNIRSSLEEAATYSPT